MGPSGAAVGAASRAVARRPARGNGRGLRRERRQARPMRGAAARFCGEPRWCSLHGKATCADARAVHGERGAQHTGGAEMEHAHARI